VNKDAACWEPTTLLTLLSLHVVGPCGYFCIPAGPTAVRAECRRSARLLASDVRTHNSTATGASLVTRPGTNPVPVVCCGVYHRVHGTAPAYLSDSLRPTSEIVARRCLHSADTTTLQVPSTHRATLRDRAFLVAAARAWNSLPPETRACSSLLTFRRETNLTFSVSHTADLALSIRTVSWRLRWAVNGFGFKPCKVPRWTFWTHFVVFSWFSTGYHWLY